MNFPILPHEAVSLTHFQTLMISPSHTRWKTCYYQPAKEHQDHKTRRKNSLAANLGKKPNTRRRRKNKKKPNRRRRRNKKKPKQEKKKQTRWAWILLQNSKEGDASEGRNEYLTNFLFWPSMEWMVTGRFKSWNIFVLSFFLVIFFCTPPLLPADDEEAAGCLARSCCCCSSSRVYFQKHPPKKNTNNFTLTLSYSSSSSSSSTNWEWWILVPSISKGRMLKE